MDYQRVCVEQTLQTKKQKMKGKEITENKQKFLKLITKRRFGLQQLT